MTCNSAGVSGCCYCQACQGYFSPRHLHAALRLCQAHSLVRCATHGCNSCCTTPQRSIYSRLFTDSAVGVNVTNLIAVLCKVHADIRSV